VPYTFFNGPSDPVAAPERAVELQEYLTSFAIHGVLSSKSAAEFPTYGIGVLKIEDAGYSVVRDSTANERNTWWQKTLCMLSSIPTTIFASLIVLMKGLSLLT
jgi:hypothetical protein